MAEAEMKWFIAFAIIASCLALTLAAVWNAVHRGPRGHPIYEIDHLSQAVQAYKEEATQFPPCMADTDPRQRKERFMQHIQVAWINASEYKPTVAGYDETNRNVRDVWKYNFAMPDGSLGALDLDNLDAAESLVFWLGGFPTPVDPTTKNPIASRKLFGFHRDSDDPFKRDPANVEGLEPMRYRTEPKFQFDPLRLVDNDGDGWLEYVPITPDTNRPNAPYVYFDAPSYIDTLKQLATMGDCDYPRDLRLMRAWGTAVPYLESFHVQRPELSRWARDRSFQIVSAGLDGKYGRSLRQRFTVSHPVGTYDAADGYQQAHAVDTAEQDNLTNLSKNPVGQSP